MTRVLIGVSLTPRLDGKLQEAVEKPFLNPFHTHGVLVLNPHDSRCLQLNYVLKGSDFFQYVEAQ